MKIYKIFLACGFIVASILFFLFAGLASWGKPIPSNIGVTLIFIFGIGWVLAFFAICDL